MKVITIKSIFTVTSYPVRRNKYVCVWINYSQILEENKVKLYTQKLYSEHFTNKSGQEKILFHRGDLNRMATSADISLSFHYSMWFILLFGKKNLSSLAGPYP